MGDLVNLRRARKAKGRRDAADQGAVNRAAFGRSGDEKAQTVANRHLADRRLDGHYTATPDAPRPDGDDAGG